jgi:hypothetical protein
MSRRITGLDLSGRFDVAARDWSPEEPTLRLDPPRTVDGGVAADVVAIGGETRRRLIAGPQATFAPHGRGQGWGTIGAADRRRALCVAIDRLGEDVDNATAVRAAVDALARGATDVVLAVPDLTDFGEAAQRLMLDAASAPRRRARLLWRPVAAFLDLLATGELPVERSGARYRFLVHGPHGLEDQSLTLRDDPEDAGHRAPLREGPGRLVAPQTGLDALFAAASERVRAANPGIDWRRCESSRLGPRLVVGAAEPGETEVLRLHNATWVEALAPSLAPADLALTTTRLPPPDRPVAASFLVTPLAAPFADALAAAASRDLGDVRVAPAATVARGALRAGRLIEFGRPHYFDRLEPIAIAISRRDGPDFESLIGPDAVVPANREYISPDLDDFVWGRGKTDAEFYVLKGDAEMRHWEVTHPEAPERDAPVTLRLRQTPGQSWARLSVTSRGWAPLERSPIDLDWEALTPLAMTRDEVLEKLRTPPPTIPELIVERSHIALWHGANWAGDGAVRHLRTLGRPATAHEWSRLLRRSRREPMSREKFWLVGTDGSLPAGLGEADADALDQALAGFAADLLAATSRRHPANNDLTLALTWCFARCPEAIQDRLVVALEAHLANRVDSVLAPSHAIRVVTQGAGRAVTGSERLRRLLRVIAQRPVTNDTINALAMILTRREEAPAALSRDLVDHFAVTLGRELHLQVARRSFALKFRNTLSAIAGLFRWRVREPYALLAEREQIAADLRATLDRTEQMLSTPAYRHVRQVEQKRDQIHKIIEFLDGRGDPDILRIIEQDDEEGD